MMSARTFGSRSGGGVKRGLRSAWPAGCMSAGPTTGTRSPCCSHLRLPAHPTHAPTHSRPCTAACQGGRGDQPDVRARRAQGAVREAAGGAGGEVRAPHGRQQAAGHPQVRRVCAPQSMGDRPAAAAPQLVVCWPWPGSKLERLGQQLMNTSAQLGGASQRGGPGGQPRARA